jgi:hypothetical protein
MWPGLRLCWPSCPRWQSSWPGHPWSWQLQTGSCHRTGPCLTHLRRLTGRSGWRPAAWPRRAHLHGSSSETCHVYTRRGCAVSCQSSAVVDTLMLCTQHMCICVTAVVACSTPSLNHSALARAQQTTGKGCLLVGSSQRRDTRRRVAGAHRLPAAQCWPGLKLHQGRCRPLAASAAPSRRQ